MSGIEIPIFGPQHGVAAVRAIGIHPNFKTNLELNRTWSYPLGGLTPSRWELEELKHSLGYTRLEKDVSVKVMIRPRGPPQSGEDFLYSDAEFETMKSALLMFKESSLLNRESNDGFVFGILRRSSPESQRLVVDRERTAELRRLAGPDFNCVFHRAFDLVVSTAGDDQGWKDELAWLEAQKMGVLTSGGLGNAKDNASVLGKILNETARTGQQLVVGGGVRSQTLESLLDGMGGLARIYALTSFKEVGMVLHSSCVRDVNGNMEFDAEEAARLRVTLSELCRTKEMAD
ncbi:copper homeostasis CutC domain-containing protein [Apiosordaria backusii]|uniref:Copper homeostasis protein cutC homolog n=1 Tax=Apiosordaria backusii TaxID=314023 RepID=A0AA40BSF1_9PEZI|nr:copper homeostasis CutC domain-containing protein [Apiosordaria backusii]